MQKIKTTTTTTNKQTSNLGWLPFQTSKVLGPLFDIKIMIQFHRELHKPIFPRKICDHIF